MTIIGDRYSCTLNKIGFFIVIYCNHVQWWHQASKIGAGDSQLVKGETPLEGSGGIHHCSPWKILKSRVPEMQFPAFCYTELRRV
jgi:hypothetical protein